MNVINKVSSTKNIGADGEILALKHLKTHGLKLTTKNFHSRFGEIDLIMQESDTTVFVEVKKRTNGIDDAIESISYSKQKKLIRTAEYYLSKIGYNHNCRFDAVVIGKDDEILWLKNIITL